MLSSVLSLPLLSSSSSYRYLSHPKHATHATGFDINITDKHNWHTITYFSQFLLGIFFVVMVVLFTLRSVSVRQDVITRINISSTIKSCVTITPITIITIAIITNHHHSLLSPSLSPLSFLCIRVTDFGRLVTTQIGQR